MSAIANRNDDQYSSAMMETLEVNTSLFPAQWRHMDDESLCQHHEVCARDTYVRGGRNDFGVPPILSE